jgi:hypothetical protein
VQHPATPAPLLACVILAHADPAHVHRLVAALDPYPVFLHCDVRASDEVFAEMTRDLPERCVVLERMATGWAKWENVAAEVAGYRAALAATDATHIAVLTGSDYPIASTAEIDAVLTAHTGRSLALYMPLPYAEWGPSGGLSRLRYRHWAYRKHMLRLPIPRQLPADITFAGGSQLKVLARDHARAVVDVFDSQPDLVRFFRRSWVADETFVGSVLNTARFVPDWDDQHVSAGLWWIGWDGSRRKSPPWLTMEHLDTLLNRASSERHGVPYVFARKFSTDLSSELLDVIDVRLRGATVESA